MQGVKGVVTDGDLLHCIFLLAKAPALIRARGVCRLWHAASRDARLWTKLVNSRWSGLIASTGQGHAPEALYQRLTRSPKPRHTNPDDVIVLLESTSPSLPFCHTYQLSDLAQTSQPRAPFESVAFPVPELARAADSSCSTDDEANDVTDLDARRKSPIPPHGLVSFGLRVAFIRKSDGLVATIKSPGSSWHCEGSSADIWDIFAHRPHEEFKGGLLARIAGQQRDPRSRCLFHIELCMCVLHAPNEGAIALGWRSYAQAEYEPDGTHLGRTGQKPFILGSDIEFPLGPMVLDALHWQ